SLKEIPKSLVIVGSGAVGVEFGSIYKSFGTDVTILEMLPRVVPVEDEEVSKELARSYKKRGINIHTSASVTKVERTKNGIAVEFEVEGKKERVEADKVLIAVGRRPRTEDIGLDKTKIKPDRGFIQVNEWLETAEPNVYAIGDIVMGTPQLAHVGSMQGMVAVAKIAGRATKPLNKNRIPGCTYSHPEIGSVGLTEAKAKETGLSLKIGRFPMRANGKAIALGETEGMVKTIFDAKSVRLLGAHLFGAEATELIQGFVIAMNLETTEEELMRSIFPHPTISETMHESVLDAFGRAIHI
ncbi:MAG TPA: FAD-dependent oxidoreductase, partial [Methylocystis sp.]|nr:FAD-dependent oxidoreductase [Methylocystis sp.]